MNADDTINAVLDLHRPVEQDGDRLCAECDDFEPDSLSSPGYWPCETVKVIARSMGELFDGMTWCDLDGHDYPDEWGFHSHGYARVRRNYGEWVRTPRTWLVKTCASCGDQLFYDMVGIHANPAQWRPNEQAYREMGEQQAESRDARRDRAMNRPRGQAGQ